ncbi:MAG TPA: DUF975 family protein [Candidatus Levilactobacillus faecigallinarum]|uniref:DUF975 family protein n=1 Tax=Candidatus Levilactobacillus faecigallinarum TaxID=2838638 RepID=A0A9D1QRJ3_9LACO|nr:DUF975 family protein [Candidatus Levilactobacillus faecigallinarum]
MTSTDRINIKAGAKAQILDHFSFYLLLSILWLALSWIGGEISSRNIVRFQEAFLNNNPVTMTLSFTMIFTFVAGILRAGAQLTMIDIDRGVVEGYTEPVQRSFKLFEKGQYFLGWLFISILTAIFVALWSLLLVIPGIIKGYAYSQAFYIYRDAFDQGHPIGALEAITQSREMMDGSKGFLFVMDLSFILWFMLSGLLMGLPGLFVMPYYDMSRAKFYNQLVVMHHTPRGDDADDEPADDDDSHVSID